MRQDGERTARYALLVNDTAAAEIRSPTTAEDVRLRILDAAEQVFAARGYGAATTREIAAAAGIGKRMLFYYFATKDSVYRAVLERVITGMVTIHEQFRSDPGPVGIAEAMEGITHFAAANMPALRVLTREIMDGGPHVADLVREHLGPLFERGSVEVARNMDDGTFRPGDPMHVLVNVAGLTLYYFQMLPLLELIWDRNPLAPDTLAERARAARDCLMHGLVATPTSRGGASS
ncbi:MAG TPA: TetR family transcriptional regulator [Candidatus Binatia bacterium]|nr:TetR family transcriptional regulator [Candidatus Binatia bacterium]